MVPQIMILADGRNVSQCGFCWELNEKNMAIAKDRGLISRLSISSKKPTTSSGEVGNGRFQNMKATKDPIGGDYLKASYVEEHKISEVKIISDVSIAKFKKDGKPDDEKFQFKITYEGFSENKGMPDTWTLNSKSKNALIDAWGDETDDWKDKPIPLALSGDGEYRHIAVDTLRIK